MALNPSLRQMVADAQVKYEAIADPLEAKRAELLDRQANSDYEPEADYPTVIEQLIILGLRKATKQELRQIILNVMATDAAA